MENTSPEAAPAAGFGPLVRRKMPRMVQPILLLLSLVFSLPLLPVECRGASALVVEGVVTDQDGARVSGATVQVRSAAGTVLAQGSTNADGAFSVESPFTGTMLAVRKPGFAEYQQAIRPSAGAELVAVTLRLGTRADELTVSADSASVESTLSAPQAVSIVDQDDLHQHGYWNLSAAAVAEPGVAAQATSPTIGGIYVRGMSGDDVPIFLDGIRVSTTAARGGISTFFNLNEASNLRTMELLRGPNTAQYGSDSLGGVIAMHSRTPELGNSGWSMHLSGGSGYESAMHAFGSDVSMSVGRGDFGLLWNGAARRVNTLRTGGGIDSHSALTRFLGLPSTVLYDRLPDTAFTQYGGMAHGQWNATERSQTVFHYQRSQQDGGKRFDQLLGGDGNLIADLRDLTSELAYLRYVAFPNHWIDYVSVTGSYLAQREERVNQGGQGNRRSAIRSEFERTTVWGFGLQLASNRSQDHQFVFGGDSYLENPRSRGMSLDPVSGESVQIRARIPDKSRYVHSGAFTQATWNPGLGRLRVSGAVRLHRASYRVRAEDAPVIDGAPLFASDSLTAANVSGRAGAVLRLGGGFWLRGYYARGFRAPTVTNLGTLGLTGNGYEVGYAEVATLNGEVGSNAGETAVSTGTPVSGLKPELSDNFDAGISWQNDRVRLDLTAFLINRQDVIAKRSLVLPTGSVGVFLGDQPVIRQDPSGIVFVPLTPNPVLVRTNADEAQFRGYEQNLAVRLSRDFTLTNQLSYVYAEDRQTGLAPDISSGVPAPNGALALRYHPLARNLWVEAAMEGSMRQDRLSSVGLSDRRTGAARTRSSIARYFANGAVAQGLIDAGGDGKYGNADDLLIPTGETLAQVQTRVLGSQSGAPLFPEIPGYALFHLRAGFQIGESQSILAGVENLTDRNYRGIAWGLDGRGRSLVIQWRLEH